VKRYQQSTVFPCNVTSYFSDFLEEKLSFALWCVTPVLHPGNGALQLLLGVTQVVTEVCGRAGC